MNAEELRGLFDLSGRTVIITAVREASASPWRKGIWLLAPMSW
jgi:hypothetical protein